MEGNKSHSPSSGQRAILVFGAPCSGKTTFGKQFADQFNATFYDLDTLKQEHNLSRQFILILVEQIAKTGSTLVIEGGIGTERERRELTEVLRGWLFPHLDLDPNRRQYCSCSLEESSQVCRKSQSDL